MGFVDLGTLLIQSINLFLVFVVLYKFVWKPAMAYLEKEMLSRRELEQFHAEMHTAKLDAAHQAQALLDHAKEEAKHIRSQSEHLASQERDTILSIARSEADRITHQAQEDAKNTKLSGEQEMKTKILNLALSLNQKIFGSTSQAHKEIIVSNIQQQK